MQMHMINRILYWIVVLSLFITVGLICGGKSGKEWVFSFTLYFYFSYLCFCYIFKRQMSLPYGVIGLDRVFLRRVIFFVSIIFMLVFVGFLRGSPG